MTQKNSNALSSRVVLLAIIAFACVLLGGGIWLVRGSMDLFSHIMPMGSANIALSTSMEPYPLKFRSKVHDNQKGDLDQIVEWSLSVPRAYVIDHKDQNGAVTHMVKEGGYAYFIDDGYAQLAVHLMDDEKNIEPYSKMTADMKKFDDNTMVISFGAGNEEWWLVKNDLCVPQDKRAEFSRKYDAGPGSNLDCFKTIKLCYFSTHLDGWGIKINVTKRLYGQPEKVCSLAKKFLNQYTVKRDVYPYSEPIHYTSP
jgi:hypothetical protein